MEIKRRNGKRPSSVVKRVLPIAAVGIAGVLSTGLAVHAASGTGGGEVSTDARICPAVLCGDSHNQVLL